MHVNQLIASAEGYRSYSGAKAISYTRKLLLRCFIFFPWVTEVYLDCYLHFIFCILHGVVSYDILIYETLNRLNIVFFMYCPCQVKIMLYYVNGILFLHIFLYYYYALELTHWTLRNVGRILKVLFIHWTHATVMRTSCEIALGLMPRKSLTISQHWFR